MSVTKEQKAAEKAFRMEQKAAEKAAEKAHKAAEKEAAKAHKAAEKAEAKAIRDATRDAARALKAAQKAAEPKPQRGRPKKSSASSISSSASVIEVSRGAETYPSFIYSPEPDHAAENAQLRMQLAATQAAYIAVSQKLEAISNVIAM